jgi:hypothetical protein
MGEPTSRELCEQLIKAIDRESVAVPDHDARLALASALPVLRKASSAFFHPSERQQAKSAYRMAAAALGIEHE